MIANLLQRAAQGEEDIDIIEYGNEDDIDGEEGEEDMEDDLPPLEDLLPAENA